MTNEKQTQSKNEIRVGSKKELIARAIRPKEPILVRAINFIELEQLLLECPERFKFLVGTEYEDWCGAYVRRYARERSGTVIVYPMILDNEKQLLMGREYNPNTDIYEMRPKIGKNRYCNNTHFNHWRMCIREFIAPVEVYNIDNLNWNQIKGVKPHKYNWEEQAREIDDPEYGLYPWQGRQKNQGEEKNDK